MYVQSCYNLLLHVFVVSVRIHCPHFMLFCTIFSLHSLSAYSKFHSNLLNTTLHTSEQRQESSSQFLPIVKQTHTFLLKTGLSKILQYWKLCLYHKSGQRHAEPLLCISSLKTWNYQFVFCRFSHRWIAMPFPSLHKSHYVSFPNETLLSASSRPG